MFPSLRRDGASGVLRPSRAPFPQGAGVEDFFLTHGKCKAKQLTIPVQITYDTLWR